MIYAFLLWPVILNFDSFLICLNNVHPSINYTYEKAKVARDKKENSIQSLIFQVSMLYLIAKVKFLEICTMKTKILMIVSHTLVLIQNPARKTDLLIQVRKPFFRHDPGKIKLKIGLKKSKYPNHIILNAFWHQCS